MASGGGRTNLRLLATSIRSLLVALAVHDLRHANSRAADRSIRLCLLSFVTSDLIYYVSAPLLEQMGLVLIGPWLGDRVECRLQIAIAELCACSSLLTSLHLAMDRFASHLLDCAEPVSAAGARRLVGLTWVAAVTSAAWHSPSETGRAAGGACTGQEYPAHELLARHALLMVTGALVVATFCLKVRGARAATTSSHKLKTAH